jgi:hypothetical protein
MVQKYTASSQPPKLLDQVRERLRVKHYSIRTEAASAHPGNCSCVALPSAIHGGRCARGIRASLHSTRYVDWIKRFIWFQGKRTAPLRINLH